MSSWSELKGIKKSNESNSFGRMKHRQVKTSRYELQHVFPALHLYVGYLTPSILQNVNMFGCSFFTDIIKLDEVLSVGPNWRWLIYTKEIFGYIDLCDAWDKMAL